MITGRETAPSRVRQRQACIENENMKITGAGRGEGGGSVPIVTCSAS